MLTCYVKWAKYLVLTKIFRIQNLKLRKVFVYTISMNIKEIRLNKKLTQQQAADIIGLSLRTYQNYESGASSRDKFKIDNIVRILNEYEKYTETKGIIPIEELIEKCEPIFTKYNLKYVYLFGSYAKK